MQVRGNSTLRGINEATADDKGNDTATAGVQAVRAGATLVAAAARKARRCGHESRELRTDRVSHNNGNDRVRQTDN